MCSVHFTLSCKILLVFSTSNNFVQCICFEIPVHSAWGYCLGPLGVGYFSGHSSSLELDSFGFWTSDTLDLATSYRKICLCFVYKNLLRGAQCSRYIWPFDRFPQNLIITEVFVCCIYGLHDIIVLGNGKVSFFPDLFLSCLPVLTGAVALLIVLIIRTSLLSASLGLLCHLSLGTLTAVFSSAWLHILCQVECPLLVLSVPQTLALLSGSVSAVVTVTKI